MSPKSRAGGAREEGAGAGEMDRERGGGVVAEGAPPRLGARLRVLLGVLVALCLSLLFTHEHVSHAWHLLGGDWLQMQFYWNAPRTIIERYGEIPLWNPYYCGGNILMGHPHSQFMVPAFLLSFLFGTSYAYRVAVVGQFLLGLWGMGALSRAFGLRGSAFWLSTCGFAFASFFAWHTMGGHFWALGFQLLPALYLCYLRAAGVAPETDARRHALPAWAWLLGGGLLLAWMVFHSGIYSVPFSCLLLGVDSGFRFVDAPRARLGLARVRPLACVAIIVTSGFLLAGPKSFPLVEFLGERHRVFTEPDDALRPANLFRMYFQRVRDWGWDKDGGRLGYGWWGEYGNDLGYTLIPLAIVGLFGVTRGLRIFRLFAHLTIVLLLTSAMVIIPVAAGVFELPPPPMATSFIPAILALVALVIYRPRHWVLGALAVVAFSLVCGQHGPFSPYAILRHFPVFKGLHVPSRYSILMVFALALLAGLGLQLLQERTAARFGRVMAVMLGVVALAATIGEPFLQSMRINLMNRPRLTHAYTMQSQFTQRRGAARAMFRYPIENKGTLHCYELAQLERSKALRGGDGPQLWPDDPRTGVVHLRSWTPHHQRIEVSAWAPTTVAINQNAHVGWRVDPPARMVEHKGLIAFEVPPGFWDVHLRYEPRSFTLGVASAGGTLGAYALVALISGGVALARRRRARRLTAELLAREVDLTDVAQPILPPPPPRRR